MNFDMLSVEDIRRLPERFREDMAARITEPSF